MARRQRIEFHHPYESLIWLAKRNEAGYFEKVALKLYKQALANARTADERDYCVAAIRRLEAPHGA